MKSSNNKITSISERDELTRQFEYVNSLIERRRFNAITTESLHINENVHLPTAQLKISESDNKIPAILTVTTMFSRYRTKDY